MMIDGWIDRERLRVLGELPFNVKGYISSMQGCGSSLQGGWCLAAEPRRKRRLLAMANKDEMPLFSFGVVTDVQYADIPDSHSFHGTPRYYRHSFESLKRAVSYWNEQGSSLSFVLQLGDLVDGHCPRGESTSAMQKLISQLQEFRGGPTYHMLGNHCLYNLPRQQLNEMLDIPGSSSSGSSYYSFVPHPDFRFIVLDSYDISVLGWPEDHPHAKQAAKILEEKNPNAEKNSPSGMAQVDKRYVKFNGGVGQEQLRWLDRMLREATKCGQKVIVTSHIPLYIGATFHDTVLWNWEEVLEVLDRYPGCVVACLAGHKHEGGYACRNGVHHRVLEAVLECPPGEDSYGQIQVYHDRIRLLGRGRMLSSDMPFTPTTEQSSFLFTEQELFFE